MPTVPRVADQRLYCFDLFGTVVTTISGDNEPRILNDWMLLPNRYETIAALQAQNAICAITAHLDLVPRGVYDAQLAFPELAQIASVLNLAPHLYVSCYDARAKMARWRLTWGGSPLRCLVMAVMRLTGIAIFRDTLVSADPAHQRIAVSLGISFASAEEFFRMPTLQVAGGRV
jgi:hypothetical protein